MEHRSTRTVIKILEFFSRKDTIEDERIKDIKENGWLYKGSCKKGEVINHLEEEMENPPSQTTISRILAELEHLGYVKRKHGRNDKEWYSTKLVQRLK